MVSDITPKDIESIIEPLAPATKKKYLNILTIVFNYGTKKKFLKENPIAQMDIPQIPRKSIRIFSNEVVEGMLRESLKSYPELLPYLILGSFCGLRLNSPELLQLTWKAIHWDTKEVIIPLELVKKKRRRIIPLSDNAIAWFEAYFDKTGINPIANKRILTLSYDKLDVIRSVIFYNVAGEKKWIKAGLRHTFCSCFLNSGKTETETALAMGWTRGTDMLWNHYHVATSEQQAKAYWEIYPPSE